MNLQHMMKQAQKMQSDLQKVEKELQNKVYVEENDLVKIEVTGKHKVLSVEIKEEDDKEILGDMIVLALNKAIEKANKDHEESVKAITGGMKLPGVF